MHLEHESHWFRYGYKLGFHDAPGLLIQCFLQSSVERSTIPELHLHQQCEAVADHAWGLFRWVIRDNHVQCIHVPDAALAKVHSALLACWQKPWRFQTDHNALDLEVCLPPETRQGEQLPEWPPVEDVSALLDQGGSMWLVEWAHTRCDVVRQRLRPNYAQACLLPPVLQWEAGTQNCVVSPIGPRSFGLDVLLEDHHHPREQSSEWCQAVVEQHLWFSVGHDKPSPCSSGEGQHWLDLFQTR